jgi:hypothetical protein
VGRRHAARTKLTMADAGIRHGEFGACCMSATHDTDMLLSEASDGQAAGVEHNDQVSG